MHVAGAVIIPIAAKPSSHPPASGDTRAPPNIRLQTRRHRPNSHQHRPRRKRIQGSGPNLSPNLHLLAAAKESTPTLPRFGFHQYGITSLLTKNGTTLFQAHTLKIPKGISSQSPGSRRRSHPGADAKEVPTPTGVAPSEHNNAGRTPTCYEKPVA